jgi:hypothetical protein
MFSGLKLKPEYSEVAEQMLGRLKQEIRWEGVSSRSANWLAREEGL